MIRNVRKGHRMECLQCNGIKCSKGLWNGMLGSRHTFEDSHLQAERGNISYVRLITVET